VFFFQAEDGIRDRTVTGVQTCALPILLEAAREQCPESPFVFMSTNKVYGDAPNELPLVELETRWDYADESQREGIDESCRIDARSEERRVGKSVGGGGRSVIIEIENKV